MRKSKNEKHQQLDKSFLQLVMFFVMQNNWSCSILINFNMPNVFFQNRKFPSFSQLISHKFCIFCSILLKFVCDLSLYSPQCCKSGFESHRIIHPFSDFFLMWFKIWENCWNGFFWGFRCINSIFCAPNLLQKFMMTPL